MVDARRLDISTFSQFRKRDKEPAWKRIAIDNHVCGFDRRPISQFFAIDSEKVESKDPLTRARHVGLGDLLHDGGLIIAAAQVSASRYTNIMVTTLTKLRCYNIKQKRT
jgi:hypothetical protein